MATDMLCDWSMFTTMVKLIKTLSRDMKGKEENETRPVLPLLRLACIVTC